jgi:hypothetical protein
MKIFYAAEDIEAFAEKGQLEIFVDENIVLTDLAVHTAQMLGIRITEKPTGPSQAAPSHSHAQTGTKANPPNAKPKGCQARPKETLGPVAAASNRPSQPIVEKLVDAVKRRNSN